MAYTNISLKKVSYILWLPSDSLEVQLKQQMLITCFHASIFEMNLTFFKINSAIMNIHFSYVEQKMF